MDKTALKLPFGSELSPDVIQLPHLLEVCKENSGNKEAIEKALLDRYFFNSGGTERNKHTMAMNCRLSLQNYKLLNKAFVLTPKGEELYEIKDDERNLYEAFAKHILLNLNGLVFVQCLHEMYLAGERVRLTTLKKALEVRNLHYPSGGKHPSIMRLWLEKAGIVDKQWRVNKAALDRVLGCEDKMDALSALDNLQKTFLKSLVCTGITEYQSTSNIVKND